MAQAGERTEKPTPRRKQEARKRGQVARSNDLTGALLLLAAAALLPTFAQFVVATSSEAVAKAGEAAQAGLPQAMAWWAGRALPGLLAPMLGMAALAALVVAGQVGLALSGEGLRPKWERVNPLAGFQRLFSRVAAVEGLKACLKFVVLGATTYYLVRDEWPRLAGLGGFGARTLAGETVGAVQSLTVRFALVWLAIGVLDLFFQRRQLEKQLMMTRDELRREMREQEGSPEVRAAQHQRRRKLAKGGMATRLKEADVLLTNPTHFAIAIQYDRSKTPAPVVVAKGADYLALKMREIAADVGLPQVENQALARELYRRCEAGDPVPRDLYLPVAEVLAYVYKTFQRARR